MILLLQRKDNAWREVVVYVDETEQAPHHFTMALAPNVSPTVSVLLPVSGFIAV
jgi:hypothetical protein